MIKASWGVFLVGEISRVTVGRRSREDGSVTWATRWLLCPSSSQHRLNMPQSAGVICIKVKRRMLRKIIMNVCEVTGSLGKIALF